MCFLCISIIISIRIILIHGSVKENRYLFLRVKTKGRVTHQPYRKIILFFLFHQIQVKKFRYAEFVFEVSNRLESQQTDKQRYFWQAICLIREVVVTVL